MPKGEKRNKLLGRLNSDHREAKTRIIMKKKKKKIIYLASSNCSLYMPEEDI